MTDSQGCNNSVRSAKTKKKKKPFNSKHFLSFFSPSFCGYSWCGLWLSVCLIFFKKYKRSENIKHTFWRFYCQRNRTLSKKIKVKKKNKKNSVLYVKSVLIVKKKDK